MKFRHAAAIVALLVTLAGCGGNDTGDGATSTSPGPTNRTPATLLGLPAIVPEDAVPCAAGYPVEDWEISAGVLLPGFVLPDGAEQAPATYRLLFQRGSESGYESVPEAATAATEWLPAEFQPAIRSIVLNHAGRNYVFEGVVVAPGAVPGGALTPCLLPAASAQIVVWYSLQVLDPAGAADVNWVWQQQGRPIEIEPFEG